MSNTSYPFQENKNNVMHAQGGEKKVMKKILSVALSTAMAFSMFASVAFGDTATLSPQDKFDALKVKGIFSGDTDGLAHLERDMTRAEFAKVITKVMGLKEVTGKYSYNDVGYNNPKNWAAPFIEAVTLDGVMQGTDLTKKLFEQKKNVTVQELAEVLVKALKLEIPTKIDNSATEWAKGSVQAAINAGLLSKDLNFQANANRSLLVEAAYEVDLIKNPIVKPVVDATKVANVATDNLKEIVVTFDGEVDKATAQLKDNYKLSGGRIAIQSAVLNDAKNAVVLTLEDDKNLVNQQKYTLSVSGVKAGNKTISASNFEFAPVDNKLPEVVSVTGLGTKAIKVVFSEPIKQSYTGSFAVDGSGFYGTPSVNNREVVIKVDSALSVGEHTLTVTGVEDFAEFKSLKSEHKFNVVEDNTAPTIAEATATLEKLTVTFSEDIDQDTLDKANVYHKRGDSKVKPDRIVRLSASKYEFYFSKENALPSYATTIFVDGVKDYSGNEIKENSKIVTAQIDTERPAVVDVRVPAGQKAQVAITFSKDLAADQKFVDLITVKDKDGKVRPISSVNFKSDDNQNILLVNFFSDIPSGTNTVDIKGIKDSTVLGNVLIDYTTTFSVGDTGAPKFDGASFKIDNQARRAVLRFNEKMDSASLVNRANYVLTLDNALVALPSDATLTVTQDGKGVVIDLPIEIGGVDVETKWQEIKVQGVKDTEGNYLDGFYTNVVVSAYNTLSVSDKLSVNDKDYKATLSGKKEIKVKLSQAVSKIVDKSKVTVNGHDVASVTANSSDVITIKTNDEFTTSTGMKIEFNGAKFVTVAQSTLNVTDVIVTQGSVGATEIADEVKPEVKFATGVTTYKNTSKTSVTDSTYTFEINFTEDLRTGLDAFIGEDLIVTRNTDSKVLTLDTNAAARYKAEVVGSTIIVTVFDPTIANGEGKYSIEVKSNAKYIQDLYGIITAGKGAVRTSN